MEDKKKYCKIHKTYYTGKTCPYCYKEKMDKSLGIKDTNFQKELKDRQLNDKIQELINKYKK